MPPASSLLRWERIRGFSVGALMRNRARPPSPRPVDVEFEPRAIFHDFERFDGSLRATARRLALGSYGCRVVEIRVHRFYVQPPPVAMEVDHQPSRARLQAAPVADAFRVRGRRPVRMGAVIFIPATAVDVDRHQLFAPRPAQWRTADYKSLIAEEQAQAYSISSPRRCQPAARHRPGRRHIQPTRPSSG